MGKSDKKLLPPLTREVEAISRCISTSLRPAAVAASFIARKFPVPLLYFSRRKTALYVHDLPYLAEPLPRLLLPTV